MSEMTARERIAEVVRQVREDGEAAGEGRWPKWMDSEGVDIDKDEPDYVSQVIAIVREALLSDSAVEASISSAGNEFVGVRADAEDMLAAALDAAFGPDKE